MYGRAILASQGEESEGTSSKRWVGGAPLYNEQRNSLPQTVLAVVPNIPSCLGRVRRGGKKVERPGKSVSVGVASPNPTHVEPHLFFSKRGVTDFVK